jgi:hypothetical protein
MNRYEKCGIYTQWNGFSYKKKILSFEAKWMELKDIILNEII